MSDRTKSLLLSLLIFYTLSAMTYFVIYSLFWVIERIA